jgi:hypothetical protein
MGVHEALVPGIPGLKSETWGTLRVFPTRWVRGYGFQYGLSPYLFEDRPLFAFSPFRGPTIVVSRDRVAEYAAISVHQRGVNG